MGFWIPRRYVISNNVDVSTFLSDLDATINERGFVLWDGQILSTPLSQADSMTLMFEGNDPIEVPPYRSWRRQQQRFFGLDEPYQMAEEPNAYSCSSLEASIPEPYLKEGELIIGILHGGRDGRYFYCPCHHASVVYTTKHRLVCMACGAMHAVLGDPLLQEPGPSLTAQEWSQLFDADGTQRDADVDLQIVDFQDVEHADLVWSTSQWEEAVAELTSYTRSSAEEIDAAIRGTERDPSVLLEAGCKPVETPPPPAFHAMEGAVDVGLLENAEHAFVDGVDAYCGSFRSPMRLLMAIPDLVRAIELVLKARLEQIEPKALLSPLNMPTVLDRLERKGVDLTVADRGAIDQLRRLRNELQHGSAQFMGVDISTGPTVDA